MELLVQSFFHPTSSTLTYVIADKYTKQTAIIDPVLDFDMPSATVSYAPCDEIIEYVKQQGLSVTWIMETHAHADHLSSAQYLKQHLGGKIVIGRGITQVQQTFKEIFNLSDGFSIAGAQFDELVDESDNLHLGDHIIRILATPGHTSDSVTYLVNNQAFIGDTLFMPDSGTSRCDFPGGDAALLYDSIQKIYALGDDTVLWVCHDYQPNGRELAFKTTVAEQKAHNIHLKGTTTKADFVNIRQQRDANLSVPKLLYPAVQVNIDAGHLPAAESNHRAYLKIPLN